MPTQIKTEQGRVIVTVSGRLVLGGDVELLENAVCEQLRLGNTRVVLDLEQLDYIDSAGIGAIAACLTDVKRVGGELRVAGLNPRWERMFKLTGVNRVLAMYPSLADALAD